MSKYTNPCPRWDGCSAGFCPLDGSGSYVPDDDLCSRLPKHFTDRAKQDLKGIPPSDVLRIITKHFDSMKSNQPLNAPLPAQG